MVSIAYWWRGTSVHQYMGVPIPTAPLLVAHRTQKTYKNFRILSRQGERIIWCAISLFTFWRRLLVNVFPFPPRTDKLLGDWHVIRQGAPNYSVRFSFCNGRRCRCRGDKAGMETDMVRRRRWWGRWGETEISEGRWRYRDKHFEIKLTHAL